MSVGFFGLGITHDVQKSHHPRLPLSRTSQSYLDCYSAFLNNSGNEAIFLDLAKGGSDSWPARALFASFVQDFSSLQKQHYHVPSG